MLEESEGLAVLAGVFKPFGTFAVFEATSSFTALAVLVAAIGLNLVCSEAGRGSTGLAGSDLGLPLPKVLFFVAADVEGVDFLTAVI